MSTAKRLFSVFVLIFACGQVRAASGTTTPAAERSASDADEARRTQTENESRRREAQDANYREFIAVSKVFPDVYEVTPAGKVIAKDKAAYAAFKKYADANPTAPLEMCMVKALYDLKHLGKERPAAAVAAPPVTAHEGAENRAAEKSEANVDAVSQPQAKSIFIIVFIIVFIIPLLAGWFVLCGWLATKSGNNFWFGGVLGLLAYGGIVILLLLLLVPKERSRLTARGLLGAFVAVIVSGIVVRLLSFILSSGLALIAIAVGVAGLCSGWYVLTRPWRLGFKWLVSVAGVSLFASVGIMVIQYGSGTYIDRADHTLRTMTLDVWLECFLLDFVCNFIGWAVISGLGMLIFRALNSQQAAVAPQTPVSAEPLSAVQTIDTRFPCPECGESIPLAAKFCRFCQAVLTEQDKARWRVRR